MEVNDYMYPVRVRVLSSEKEVKNEPDVVTMAPDIDWNFTDKEREEIIDAKMNNRLDDLFRMLLSNSVTYFMKCYRDFLKRQKTIQKCF